MTINLLDINMHLHMEIPIEVWDVNLEKLPTDQVAVESDLP
jgi:hypothetical protein